MEETRSIGRGGANRTRALVALCDEAYIDKAKAFFYNARHVGKWDGDFVLIFTGGRPNAVKDFTARGIEVKTFPRLPSDPVPHFYKYYLFHRFFKRWDHVLYLDLDLMFINEIDLFGSRSFRGLYANKDDLPLIKQFDCTEYDGFCNTGWDLSGSARFEEMRSKVPNCDAFQSCFMLYSTDIIGTDTFANLVAAHERYYEIVNRYTYEQSILNLCFHRAWRPLSTRMINSYEHAYCLDSNNDSRSYEDTICIHFGRWQAPWKKENMRFFPLWEQSLTGFDSTTFNRLKGRQHSQSPGKGVMFPESGAGV